MRRLTITDADFEAKFARLVNDRRESDANVASDVRTIIGSGLSAWERGE